MTGASPQTACSSKDITLRRAAFVVQADKCVKLTWSAVTVDASSACACKSGECLSCD